MRIKWISSGKASKQYLVLVGTMEAVLQMGKLRLRAVRVLLKVTSFLRGRTGI